MAAKVGSAEFLGDQEKLALMMTAAGSMRNLGALVGVSHQRIGRWLREGEQGGVARIPEAASEAINTAWEIYKDVANDQANATGFPIVSETPVFQYTKPRRDGSTPDRMFVDNTEFLRSETRAKIFEELAATRKLQAATVESSAETESYLEELAIREIAEGKHRGRTVQWVAKHLKRVLTKTGFIDGASGEIAKLKMFTKRAPMGPIWTDQGPKWDDPYFVAQDIERQLLEKHAPSANQPGGKLASGFIFQLAPIIKATYGETYAKPKRKKWSNKRGK